MKFKPLDIVCIGGGTGMPTLLSGFKDNPWFNVTAIVAMTDDGGSSGELSDKHGILPVGDILNCCIALAENEPTAKAILTHRASIHTVGNLLLKGMINEYGIIDGLEKFGCALGAEGTVLPMTISKTDLHAVFSNGNCIKGETAIDVVMRERFHVEKLFLEPEVKGCKEAIKAISKADAICVGPGSLFTSVLPNFLPLGISGAIKKSKAPIVFVCNLLTEGWGMNDFTVSKTVNVAESYIGRKIDKVVVNTKLPNKVTLGKYQGERKTPIVIDHSNIAQERLVEAAIWTDDKSARHDPKLLSYLVQSVIFNCLQ